MQYKEASNGTLESATGEQRRVWGKLAEAPSTNQSIAYLKIRTEGTSRKVTIVTFNFTPVDSKSTNYVELIPIRTSSSSTSVTEELVLMEFTGDTSRDGIVDRNDLDGRTEFSMGSAGRGAIILANCDDDDGNKFPDNWPGAIPGWGDGKVFSATGQRVELPLNALRPAWIPATATADYLINGAADLLDCGRFHLSYLPALPDDVKVILKVTKPYSPNGTTLAVEPAFFSGAGGGTEIKPEHRVRIFLPTKAEGGNLVPQANDFEIIGPAAGDSVTFAKTANLAGNVHNIQLLAKNGTSGYMEFAAEGLEPGATVDVWLEIRKTNNTLVGRDRFRLKVAPFIAVSNATPVDKVIVGRTAGVPPGFDNTPFINYLEQNAGVPVIKWPADTSSGLDLNKFVQDQYEIGFSEMPAYIVPQRMRIALALPRRNVNAAMNNLMTDGIGVHARLYYIAEALQSSFQQDYGGNIECTPPCSVGPKFYPEGRVLVGHSAVFPMSSDLIKFLQAQEIQPLVTVDLGWSTLHHVDEAILFLSAGNSSSVISVIASAESATTRLNALINQPMSIIFWNSENIPFHVPYGPFKASTFLDPTQPTTFFPNLPSFTSIMAAVTPPLNDLHTKIYAETGFPSTKVPQVYGPGAGARVACATSCLLNALVVGNKVIVHASEDITNASGQSELFGLFSNLMTSQGLQALNAPQGYDYHLADGGVHCATLRLPKVSNKQYNDVWWNKYVQP